MLEPQQNPLPPLLASGSWKLVITMQPLSYGELFFSIAMVTHSLPDGGRAGV